MLFVVQVLQLYDTSNRYYFICVVLSASGDSYMYSCTANVFVNKNKRDDTEGGERYNRCGVQTRTVYRYHRVVGTYLSILLLFFGDVSSVSSIEAFGFSRKIAGERGLNLT